MRFDNFRLAAGVPVITVTPENESEARYLKQALIRQDAPFSEKYVAQAISFDATNLFSQMKAVALETPAKAQVG